jgi:predicted nucleotidyltransferase
MVDMLLPVVEALGQELLRHVAFVGGSTTAFLITDPITRQAVRFTEDVDLIVHVEGQAQWQAWQRKLYARGFRASMQDDVICRMRLGALKVDFMPDDELILGFSNRWYRKAIEHAEPFPLNASITINLLAPAYFVATKLEAYQGRGGNDPMSSHDLEDIINLVDGRETLASEIAEAGLVVRRYIAEQFNILEGHRDFDYAVQGNLQDSSRSSQFFRRWEWIAAIS